MGINEEAGEKPTTVLVSRYIYELNTQNEMTTIHRYLSLIQNKAQKKTAHVTKWIGNFRFHYIELRSKSIERAKKIT